MITALDTSVLLDVFTADATFGDASRRALRSCRQDGRIIACEVVWAEVATAFATSDAATEAFDTLGLRFDPLGPSAALRAAEAWASYRERGGRRQRVFPDFLVGAHAVEAADLLLTRDRGFHRDYFGDLEILDPTPSPQT